MEIRSHELNLNLNICPTCGTRITMAAEPVEGLPGPDMPTQGEYRYLGTTYICDCNHQNDLRIRYLLANIPARYWRYGEEDWYGNQDAWEMASEYVTHWPQYRMQGIGMEFYSPGQGSGKTFLATWIARQLVQLGERVYYTRMLSLMDLYQHPDRFKLEAKVRNATALVLDELGYGISESQTGYYASKLEDLVRDRVDNALPTIITTNMEPQDLDHYYPRIYSVLAGAQIRHEVSHEDVRRRGDTLMLDRALIQKGETRPIC